MLLREMDAQCCMICETPYSVLNSINLVFHRRDRQKQFDLYIGDNFKNSDRIAEKIKTYGLFAHVWRYRRVKNRLSPSGYLRKAVMDSDYRFIAYDEIYLSSATIFPTYMILACRKADVYYMDDGLCSYADTIYVEPLGRIISAVYTLTGRKIQRRIPGVVYLNNARMCMEDAAYEARQLPAYDPKETRFHELLRNVFDYSPAKCYRDRRIIYLAQSLETDLKISGIAQVEQDVEHALLPFLDTLIYRPHPRDRSQKRADFHMDRESGMWELICMNEISEKTILMGSFSNALITPKLIFDKEPWVIFTYRLYEEYLSTCQKDLVATIAFMVHCVKKAYRNPEKVICVEKSGDIETSICRILNDG